jgi:hypothetical protein
LIVFLVLTGAIFSTAQKTMLQNAIQEIEVHSSFIFNYDSEALSTFEVNEFNFIEYSSSEILSFFEQTPFQISIDQNLVFILPLVLKSEVICGMIISQEDGESLPFATIKIENGQGIVTDENGVFKSEISTYKNQYCLVSYVGKEPRKILLERLVNCPQIGLENLNSKDHSILIRSYILHGIEEGSSFGGVNLNLNLPSNNHLMRNSGIYHSMQLIPGISSPDDSATGLNIRGGSADHNLILWEGAPIYGQGYLYGMISPVNPYSIDNVTVYKSNHSSSNDNRIGGVIDMRLPNEIPGKTELSVGSNMTEGHINLGVPILKNKVGLFFSARKSMYSIFEDNNPTYNSYLNKVFNSQRILGEDTEELDEHEPSLDFYDINAKSIINFTNRTSLHSSFLLTKSNSTNLATFSKLESQGQDSQSAINRIISNELKFKLDENSTLKLIGRKSIHEKEAEFEFSQSTSNSTFLENEESNSISDTQLELMFSKSFDKVSTQFGYVLDRKSTVLEIEQKSSQLREVSSKSKVSKQLHHIYSQTTYTTNGFKLEGGNRLSYDPDVKKFFNSPSISSRWKIRGGLYHKLSAGWYHQFIKQIYNPIDADLITEEPTWTLNTNLEDPILNSAKITSGFIFKKKGWLIDLEGYIHDTRGLSVENPNVRNVISSNAGNQIISKGLDLLINKRIEHFNTSFYYSWAQNKITVPDLQEDENESFLANNDQTHILRVSQMYSRDNISVGLNYIYKTGLPFTSNSSLVYSDDDDFYELEHVQINNSRLLDYHRLDLSLSSRFKWKEKQIELSASVLNILNRNNIGSRKSLVSPSVNSTEPQLIEINRNLLQRTFKFSGRIFF